MGRAVVLRQCGHYCSSFMGVVERAGVCECLIDGFAATRVNRENQIQRSGFGFCLNAFSI
jgi:hypothetical protein